MSAPSDLTGRRFGRLVVLGPAGRDGRRREGFWACRCDCGGESVVARSNLTTGHTRSCGCGAPRTPDLAGRKFGRLTAVRLLEGRVRGRRAWECRCDCGRAEPVVVITSALLNGNTQSCGCLQRDQARVSGRARAAARRDLVCPHCNAPFRGTIKQIYCSRVCKEAALLAPRTERACAFCGRPILARGTQEYCSDACRHAFRYRYRDLKNRRTAGAPSPLARQLADAAEELERKGHER